MINGSYYIGSCKSLNDRLILHNKGLVKSTGGYILWKLVFFEEYPDLQTARKRERQIKSWKKREAIEKMINISKFK